MQGEFRVALHMCLDALQGKPLPASAPAAPVAAAPPQPQITTADTDALMARFKARYPWSLSCQQLFALRGKSPREWITNAGTGSPSEVC